MSLAFRIIQQQCRIGDLILITSSTGTIEGTIAEIADSELALTMDDGGFSCISGDDIKSVRLLKVTASNAVDSTVLKGLEEVAPVTTSPESLPHEPQVEEIIPQDSVGITSGKHENSISYSAKEQDVSLPSAPTEQPVAPTTSRNLSQNELLKIQWRDLKWKRQVCERILTAFTSLGDYSELDENRVSLKSTGYIDSNTNGIIIDSITGAKYFYDTQDLLVPLSVKTQAVFFILKDRRPTNILPATKVYKILDEVKMKIYKTSVDIKKPSDLDPFKLMGLFALLQELLPTNQTIAVLLEKVQKALYNFGKDKISHSSVVGKTASSTTSNSAYEKAKKLTNARKHEEALKYYLEAISMGDYPQTCINDVGTTYNALYKQARLRADADGARLAERLRMEALSFIHEHRSQLPETPKTWNFLEGFYYSLRDFENFATEMYKLMQTEEVRNNVQRLSMCYNKLGAAFIEDKKYEEARAVIDKALKLNPENVGAQRLDTALKEILRLKEVLQSADDEQQAREIERQIAEIRPSDFSTFADSGLGEYVIRTIEAYTEMDGLPEFVKANREYTPQTLKTIRGRISQAGKIRPEDVAKWTLTEVKLMQLLELQDDDRTIAGEMARYCEAMAELKLYEEVDMEVVRFFYNQSFALRQDKGKDPTRDSIRVNENYISAYLQTLAFSSKTIRERLGKGTNSLKESLQQVLAVDASVRTWENILSLMLYNNDVTARVVGCLYDDEMLRVAAVHALNDFNITLNSTSKMQREEFTLAWDELRERRLNDRSRVTIQISKLGNNSSKLEEISSTLRVVLEQCRLEPWLNNTLDKQRMGQILDVVLPPIDTFLSWEGYQNKLNAYSNIKSQIDKLQMDIKENPTKLSYEAFLPILSLIGRLADAAFDNVLRTSKPEIGIDLLSSETVVQANNHVSLQVLISNGKNSSPVYNVSVCVEDTPGVTFIDADDTKASDNREKHDNIKIDGGQQHIFSLQVCVSDAVVQNEGGALTILCTYLDRENKGRESKKVCQLDLYSESDYVPIFYNPYKSGDALVPGQDEIDTFVGREDFMAGIVNNICNKQADKKGYQVIIYGQKRCGKSSVLEHMKAQLTDRGFTCISITLDEISDDLNELSFYYLILSRLTYDINRLRRYGKEAPEFRLISREEFAQKNGRNYASTLIQCISDFRDACAPYPEWRDRRLVLLIDEFTIIYNGIEKKTISETLLSQWKAITQHPDCNFSVILVGQDVTPIFLRKPYAANPAQVLHKKRLEYLTLTEAQSLIEEPMKKACGGISPYISKAVDRIIEFTSRNPYYIQLFCHELIDFMNKRRLKKVSEAAIEELAATLNWTKDNFDNLINGGEDVSIQENKEKEEQRLEILRVIARLSKVRGYDYCTKSDILAEIKSQDQATAVANLDELDAREVLDCKEESYKIGVRLFKEWLQKN